MTAEAPSVRLAVEPGAAGGKRVDGALANPNVRLAWFELPAVDSTLTDQRRPALLVSYYYLEPFLEKRATYVYRDWVMDSGAFSAHNSGVAIDLSKYIDKCCELLHTDQTLIEVFALDVIPADRKPLTVAKAAEQSAKNCEAMWEKGIPAIPCFHAGEPEEFLFAMAKTYPKIAIGGVALERGDFKYKFCEQVFARVWPKKIHGFGMSSETLVYGLPFHSVDATNWEIAPCAFGNWMKFGQMSVRGSNQDLRSQVKFYLDMESKARVRWKKEMEILNNLPDVTPVPRSELAVRLAMNGPSLKSERKSIETPTAQPAVTEPVKPVEKVDPNVEPAKYLDDALNPLWMLWYRARRKK